MKTKYFLIENVFNFYFLFSKLIIKISHSFLFLGFYEKNTENKFYYFHYFLYKILKIKNKINKTRIYIYIYIFPNQTN